MTTEAEILVLEESLRQAELGPDAAFFERVLDDQAILVGPDGVASMAKAQVVAAHQPGMTRFTRVTMTDLKVVDHGDVAVVTCDGRYESVPFTGTLKFMRVWMRRDGQWRIVAGSISK